MSAPHRVMFPAGGVWAIVAVGPVALDTGFDLARSPLGGVAAWHAHEMVFGFAAAMFAGYALTAMTSWPGTARLPPAGVALLVALWGLARLSAAGAFGPDLRLAAPAAVAFMVFVTLILVRSALRSRSLRATPLVLFSLAITCFQIAVLTGATPPRIPVLGFAALLSVVGGRMVAGFTRNSLADSDHAQRRLRIAGICGLLGSAMILVALGLETVGAAPEWLVICLLVAAAGEAMRATLWMCREILKDGLLIMAARGVCVAAHRAASFGARQGVWLPDAGKRCPAWGGSWRRWLLDPCGGRARGRAAGRPVAGVPHRRRGGRAIVDGSRIEGSRACRYALVRSRGGHVVPGLGRVPVAAWRGAVPSFTKAGVQWAEAA